MGVLVMCAEHAPDAEDRCDLLCKNYLAPLIFFIRTVIEQAYNQTFVKGAGFACKFKYFKNVCFFL